MPAHPLLLAFGFVTTAVEAKRCFTPQIHLDSLTTWRTRFMRSLVGEEPSGVSVSRSQNYEISHWRELRRRSFPLLPKLVLISPPSLEVDVYSLREELDLFVPIIRGYHTEKEHRRPYVETAPSSPEVYPPTPPPCSWPDPPSPYFPYTCEPDFVLEIDADDAVVSVCHIVRGGGLKAAEPNDSKLTPVTEGPSTLRPRIPKTVGSRKWRHEQRRVQRMTEGEIIITSTTSTSSGSSAATPLVGSSVTLALDIVNKPTAPRRHTPEARPESRQGAQITVLNPALLERGSAPQFTAVRPPDTLDNAGRKRRGRTWSKQQRHLAKLAAGD
ncbi:hypothetical protein EYR36_011807 [Pleurotus pulmonarius]|nr:hypothetical protein EYR36_011807 [Pleurotus pulmonarius]